MINLRFWMAAAALATVSAPAAAENVRPQDPGSLVRALQANGYAATLKTDNIGDPLIESSVAGSAFEIFFYNCKDHKECATIQFHSAYRMKEPVSLERLNEWNMKSRFGNAYRRADGGIVLEMDVDLDDGGVAPLLFIDNLEFWETILPGFEKHIGYRS